MEAKVNAQETGSFGSIPSLSWEKSRIVSIEPDSTLVDAAQLMLDEQVGTVLVMDREDSNEILGILTDRDLALCLATEDNPTEVLVEDVMTDAPITASVTDDIFKLVHIMKSSGVTRLPLMSDDGEVMGVATAKNLIEILLGSLFDLTQIAETQKQNEKSQH